MTVDWDELTQADKQGLERLFNHGNFPVLRATAERLVTLGLAEQKQNGVGISRAGEELVAQHGRRM